MSLHLLTKDMPVHFSKENRFCARSIIFIENNVFPYPFSLVQNPYTFTHQKCPVPGSIWASLLSIGTGCIRTSSTFRLMA